MQKRRNGLRADSRCFRFMFVSLSQAGRQTSRDDQPGTNVSREKSIYASAAVLCYARDCAHYSIETSGKPVISTAKVLRLIPTRAKQARRGIDGGGSKEGEGMDWLVRWQDGEEWIDGFVIIIRSREGDKNRLAVYRVTSLDVPLECIS